MKKHIYMFLIIFSISFQSMGNKLHSYTHYTYNFESGIIRDEGIKESTSTKSAKEIIHNIVNVVGLKPNFEIRPADISNAAAVNYGGKRFILYDPAFMATIQNATQTDWAAISILAHEIGHHLNGHTMMTKGGNPALELEADEFSGFVLRKMGASLVEAQKAMNLISDVIGSATHPKRSLRLTAIAKGYNSANSQLLAAVNQITPMQEIQVENEVIVAKADDLRLDKQNIFSEVHFNKMPGRKFFLTKNLNLVEVTEEGVEVLGDIVKSHNNQLELNIHDEDQTIKLNISLKGILYNQNQTVVGYLKSPVV